MYCWFSAAFALARSVHLNRPVAKCWSDYCHLFDKLVVHKVVHMTSCLQSWWPCSSPPAPPHNPHWNLLPASQLHNQAATTAVNRSRGNLDVQHLLLRLLHSQWRCCWMWAWRHPSFDCQSQAAGEFWHACMLCSQKCVCMWYSFWCTRFICSQWFLWYSFACTWFNCSQQLLHLLPFQRLCGRVRMVACVEIFRHMTCMHLLMELDLNVKRLGVKAMRQADGPRQPALFAFASFHRQGSWSRVIYYRLYDSAGALFTIILWYQTRLLYLSAGALSTIILW